MDFCDPFDTTGPVTMELHDLARACGIGSARKMTVTIDIEGEERQTLTIDRGYAMIKADPGAVMILVGAHLPGIRFMIEHARIKPGPSVEAMIADAQDQAVRDLKEFLAETLRRHKDREDPALADFGAWRSFVGGIINDDGRAGYRPQRCRIGDCGDVWPIEWVYQAAGVEL